jgi:hypothetical protein
MVSANPSEGVPPPAQLNRRLQLPHDIIKCCLNFLPEKDLLGARLINKQWAAAVPDSVECFISTEDSRPPWEGTLVQGLWTPRYPIQVKLLTCCIHQTYEPFQRSIRRIDLSGAGLKGDLARLHINSFTSLEELNLSDTNITSAPHLSTRKSLKILNLF